MATVATIPAGSLEALLLPRIHAWDETSGEPADPTVLPAQVALTPWTPRLDDSAAPDDLAWVPATWVTETTPAGVLAYGLRVDVGPGGDLTPAVGRWIVWSKITGTRLQPVRPHGLLVITGAGGTI